jgi:hypothetical protein
MADSLTKYKARKLVDKWSALALTAQVKQLKSAAKPPKKTPTTQKTASKSNKKDNKWAWKDVLPKPGKPTKKEFGGKSYHINCKYHPNQWVCNPTEECSKNPANAGMPPPGVPDSNFTTTNRRLKAAKIAAALLSNEDDVTEDLSESKDDY